MAREDAVADMVESIRLKLYEEFYNGNEINKDVALKIVGGAKNSQFIRDPNSFKELAEKISLKYYEFIANNKNNPSKKDFITEKELTKLVNLIVMKDI